MTTLNFNTTNDSASPHIPELPEDADALGAALAYAKAGLYLLPVKPGTKNPGSRVGERWHTKSSCDQATLAAWYAGTADGIAVDLGRSGLVVIDVDMPESMPGWLQTALSESGSPYQATRTDTPGRGHYLFRQPSGRALGCGKGKLAGCGLDVKGTGGVIVVAPTVHPSGGQYRWITTGTIPALPDVIAEQLTDNGGDRKSAATDAEVRRFIETHTESSAPGRIKGWANCWSQKVFVNCDSRHDAMVEIATWALEEARCGYYSAREALNILRPLFTTSFKGDDDRQTAESAAEEFGSIVAWAVSQANAHPLADLQQRRGGSEDRTAAGVPSVNGRPVTANTTGTHQRRARLTWANEIAPKSVQWAWTGGLQEISQGFNRQISDFLMPSLVSDVQDSGRIATGTIAIAAGSEGLGKSSFGIVLAAKVSTGKLSGAWYGTPGRVLYVAVEDSWEHTIVPRLMAADADLSRIARFGVATGDDENMNLSLPYDNALLEEVITENGIGLVVLDPLMSLINEEIDTHREREVRKSLDPLVGIADRTGAVILGIAHFNKGSGTDISARITGSGAFKNVPRAVFGFARDPESGNCVITQSKNSLGRSDLPSLGYRIESHQVGDGISTGRFVPLGVSERSVTDILAEGPKAKRDGDAGLTPAQRFIVEYITKNGDARGEVMARDIITEGLSVGFTEIDLKNARQRSRKITTRRAPAGWIWSLTGEFGKNMP